MALKVKVICPEKVLFDGEAEYLLAPGKLGHLGIMENHTPLFAELLEGEIIITTNTGEKKEEIIPLKSGILKVRANNVTILVL